MPTITFVAPQTILPGHDTPVPASIDVDLESGIITAVRDGVDPAAGHDGEHVLHIPETKILIPGLVDSHVHLNQPGRTAWEGFQTGTAAAVSGGVTTLVDMPLNSIPPTVNLANLAVKRGEAVKTGVRCDVAFWGGIIPGNAPDLVPLLEAGVKGFKCFLINSGVDEFPHVEEPDLVKACDALKGTDALILFHAELETFAGEHADHVAGADASCYSTFLQSRPPSLELSALDLILRLARAYPSLRFHIVHLSAADALPRIRAARSGADGHAPVTNLTIETCYHYLCLCAEDIPPNATQYKCCPPIRSESNRRLIVNAVLDGTIDYIVSDHSPCTPELKRGDFMTAWGGVSGLGLGLPLIWTQMADRASLAQIVRWLGSSQAKQVGLGGKKGVIAPGADADFAVFDPDALVKITTESLVFKNKLSPYVGKTLRGRVDQTYLRGHLVWDDSARAILAEPSTGVLV